MKRFSVVSALLALLFLVTSASALEIGGVKLYLTAPCKPVDADLKEGMLGQ
jgi:hypothetical protein